jgi:hypothetical protein
VAKMGIALLALAALVTAFALVQRNRKLRSSKLS